MSLSNYEKAARLCSVDSFQSRVRGILVSTALSIKSEPFETTEGPNNTTPISAISFKRSSLADHVLGNTAFQIERFSYIVALSQPAMDLYSVQFDEDTTQKAFECAPLITDEVIQGVISDCWNGLAGVNSWDL